MDEFWKTPIGRAIQIVVASAILGGVTYKVPEACPCTGWKWAFAIAGIAAVTFIILWVYEKWF